MRKPIPPYLTFEDALKRGMVSRMESDAYTKWVKSLPCCHINCKAPADDPHHPYDVGFGGMGTKVPDFWVIPLCRRHHDLLHHNVTIWEDFNGPQLQHALMTITRAIYEGVLR